MGEPSGISSEILVKAWINEKENLIPFFVVDDKAKIEFVINLFKLNAKIKLIRVPMKLSRLLIITYLFMT